MTIRILPLALVAVLALSCRSKDGDSASDGTVGDSAQPSDGGADGGGDDTGPTDADGDGYAGADDCDDTDADVSPAAAELCDGIDNNCDGTVDEDSADDAGTWFQDDDGDGYGVSDSYTQACDQPSGFVAAEGDCDDADVAYNPGADESDCADPNDYNCDGSVGYADADADGYAACEDCDDGNADANDGAEEVCDEVDNDCDGDIDEDVTTTFYADTDTDGYGDATSMVEACEPPTGYSATDDDCDDADIAVNPGATEICNGIDDDCDGDVDGGSTDASTWYADSDADSYGDATRSVDACDQPSGYVSDDQDCDDSATAVNPAASEICDAVDNDCDGDIDDDDASVTGSGTWYIDTDGDGYGESSDTVDGCAQPSGYAATSDDCDDEDADTNPGADEYCDGVDRDCDGTADEDAVDGGLYATDADGDGFGEAGSTAWACEGADNELDCDDADATEPVVVDQSTGASTGDGSASAPFDLLQDGVDTALSCVAVYPGTYTESVDFGGASIAMTSVDGAETAIIDATGLGYPAVIAQSGEEASVSGFTITGGDGMLTESSETYSCGSACTGYYYYDTTCGGGVYVADSSMTLDQVEITGNVLAENATSTSGDDYYYAYSFGGGLCADNAMVEVGDSLIGENYAYDGGGLYAFNASVVWLERSEVIFNTAYDGAGAEVEEADLAYINVLSAWNMAGNSGGGVLASDATVDLMNVTLGEDDAALGGGIYADGTSDLTVNSTIVYGANTGEGVYVSGATLDIDFSNVYGNAAGEYSGVTDPTGTDGNISADPVFTDVTDDGDPDNDDWTLDTGSPSIDAGDTDTGSYDDDGTVNDQGAYGGPDSDWAD